jgi:hypothetical protein
VTHFKVHQACLKIYRQGKEQEEMDGACGTCGSLEGECGVLVEDLCVDGRIILKIILKIFCKK